jgi:tripartite-type tricarboxylate transporter receptor subunit TctC
MKMRSRFLSGAVIGAALLALTIMSAHAADSVAQFYKGREIKLYIGSTAGGGYDGYGRLIARHIGKYLPGDPTIVPVNMPGAGSNRLAAYLYSVAPKDGSEFGIIFPGAVLDPLIGTKKVKDDPSKLNYIGSANSEDFLCFVRSDAPVKSFEDVMKTQVTMGASAAGGSTVDMAALDDNLLGAKFRVVAGYPGSRQVTLAIEQGEVQGACGLGWSSIQTQHPEWVTEHKIRILVQDSNRGLPELKAMGVPLSYSFAKTDEQRKIMELAYSQEIFGRPFVAPPGVPKDRVEALRKAFMATLADKETLADAKKMRLDIDAISGEEVQALVAKIYSYPPALVAKTKQALIYKAP